MDLRVPASKMSSHSIKAITDTIPSTVMISDLQDLIPTQSPALTLQQSPTPNQNWNFTDDSFWLQYHDFATLNNFTETMVQQYPDLVKRVSIGKTFEGREIFGMSIHGFKKKKDKKKKKTKSWFFEDDEDCEGEDDEEQDIVDLDGSEMMTATSEEDGDVVSSWWSWLFNHAPKRSIKKPSRPKKHPKAIVIHAAQHARGNTNLEFLFTFGIIIALPCTRNIAQWAKEGIRVRYLAPSCPSCLSKMNFIRSLSIALVFFFLFFFRRTRVSWGEKKTEKGVHGHDSNPFFHFFSLTPSQ